MHAHGRHRDEAMDTLSELLQSIRLDGALFLHAEFREPWCVDAPSGTDLARQMLEGAPQLAICHLVLEGRCWVRMPDGPALELHAGEVAVLPHGDPHLIGSGVHHAPVTLAHLVQPRLPDLTRIRYGGDGARMRIVCGWFAYERHLVHPLIAALPPLFCVDLARRPCGAWLAQSVRTAMQEEAMAHPGAQVIGAKVAEALFIESVRGHVEALPPAQTGWLAGLRDPLIGRCLALLHAQPARAWSMAELAREAGMSRSVLADRFRRLVGVAPMHYLARWRMALATRLLREPGSTLTRVGEAVGYPCESAFHRAFKSEHGVAPGQWRLRNSGWPHPPSAVRG